VRSAPLVIVIALVAAANAAPATVDWARGLVTAEGIGLADRHAPNPAVARGTSRRAAEAAARKALAAKVVTVPLAAGGTVGDKAKADKAIAARVDRAVAHAITVAADPETDGAWRVTLAVPIEALRQAVSGARPLAAGAADAGPTVIVVEAATAAKPGVGWTVGGLAAPTLWVAADAVPPWAKDAPRMTAKSAKAGAIEVAGTDATAATLFVIITGK
jgi:1,4-alpha-glucan branching enzyme